MLTQLATIKTRLGLDLFDTSNDPLLTSLLAHVSARFAAECNRVFDYGAGLTYEFRADQLNIVVDHPPIQSVAQFDLKSTETEGWLLQSSISYLLSPTRTVIELAQPLGGSRQLGRVTYTGGYVLPGATPSGDQIALPDEVELACVEQAAYWYQRRGQLGLVSVNSGPGLVQQYQKADLLPQVQAGRGKFLIPGLIDVHVHLEPGGGTTATLPPSVKTVRITFDGADGSRCCLAVDPSCSHYLPL
jgi:hypothetical protein